MLVRYKLLNMLKKVILISLTLVAIQATAQNEQKKDSIQQIEEVIIQATRAQKQDPFTVSNVTKKEIEKRNLGQDIPVLLNFLPNVVTTSDAGAGVGYTGIRVRGSDATRVNVTINGIPLNDSESQASYWVDLPDFASSTQSMQLQRGVGTSTNGAGAFGASLNLLTNGIEQKAGVSIDNSFGSYNTRKHNIQFDSGILGNNFSFSGRLSAIKSDGYVDRASSDLQSFFISGAYQDDKTMVKLIAFGGHEITYQAWYGVDKDTYENNPTFNYAGAIYDDAWNVIGYYDNQVDDYTQTHYQMHINHNFDANWNATMALHYTKGSGFYESYKQDEDFSDYGMESITIDGTLINTTDLIRQKWLDNDFYGITYSLKYDNLDNFKVIFGGAINQYDGDHFGKVIWARYASNTEKGHKYYQNNGLKDDLNSFVKAQFKADDKWQVFADLQVRNVSYKTTDFLSNDIDANWLFFNPKVGITYLLNDNNNIYVSYARGNKEPIRDDYQYATETPEAETLDDFEMGWRYNSDKVQVQTNAYLMNYKNQLVLTGALTDVGDFIRANSGKSYRLGVEVDAAVAFAKKWQWATNFSISQNQNIDFYLSDSDSYKNTSISYSPDFIAASNIVFTPMDNLQVSLLSKYVGSQFMSNTELDASKLDAYFTTDLHFQWKKENLLGMKQIAFTGMLNNIFNEKYASNGYMWGTTPYYFPQAGTNFLLGLNLAF